MQRTFAIRQMRTFSKEFSIEFDGTSSSWLIVLKIIDKNDSFLLSPTRCRCWCWCVRDKIGRREMFSLVLGLVRECLRRSKAKMLLCHLVWYKFLFTTNHFERKKKTTQKTLFIAIVWAYSTIPMTSTTIHVLSGNIYWI